MSDLISRQAAIDALVKAIREDPYYDSDGAGLSVCDVRVILNELPSAQPEQKTGKWIEKEVYETRRKEEMQIAKCSNCEKYLTTPHIYSFNHYNYCPHCGTKMGG